MAYSQKGMENGNIGMFVLLHVHCCENALRPATCGRRLEYCSGSPKKGQARSALKIN